MSFSEQDKSTIELLKEAGQGHILQAWPAEGDDDKKKSLLAQVRQLDADYPGGIRAYVENAKKLLKDSREGVNPFEGFSPLIPHGARLAANTPDFLDAERVGMTEMAGACFVIVAGGLGERLGYNGIKLELPSEITTETCFLDLYCQYIQALQARARETSGDSNLLLPLCIMTSGDTHEKTVELLEANNYFGIKDQLTIVKQEKVPALTNNDAQFALSDPYTIETKPHGHGDVHTLLHSKGVVQKWHQEGRQWVCFLQDTNGLVFRSLPAAIGVSKKNGFVVNSLTVPRRPGEAVGGIVQLSHPSGKMMTINVEYNQLDPLLKASGKTGDTADETGYSPFPGNINVLVFQLPSYVATLDRTGGSIPEFVNPKYADAEKTTFKKPTRLECMMQDYPKLLSPEDLVGFTQVDRWISFSAVKNNVVDAAAKMKSTGVPECGSSGEADMYISHRKILSLMGVDVEVEGPMIEYAGIATTTGAHVVLEPSFGCTFDELKSRFPSPADVHISSQSTLIVSGDVTFQSLQLDGTLVIKAAPGAKVVVKDLKVTNGGWHFKPVAQTDSIPEKFLIRGYVLDKIGQEVHEFNTAGSFSL